MEKKEEVTKLLGELSPTDFGKVKQLYKMTNRIEGNTIEEFVNNLSEKTMQGVINLCNKQLGK